MIRVLACLTERHDPLAVFAAAVICAGSALACALLLRGNGRTRPLLAGAAIGFGAWSTHFVAMLAYDAGLPMGFAPATTLHSVALALTGSMVAFILWSGGTPARRALGGTLLGLSIAAMHHLGMTAVQLPGHIQFVPGYVTASAMAAALLGALALLVLRPDASRPRRLAGAGLLVLTIVSLHFIGMGGVEVFPDPAVEVPSSSLPRLLLGALVTTVTAAALAAGLAVLALEARVSLAAEAAEAGRLRSLADAAFEALALIDGNGQVTDASSRLADLAGTTPEALIGRPFAALFDSAGPGSEAATLVSGIPVELRRRDIETAAGPREVVSLRDLRERIESGRIRHLAMHDALTGLANRAMLGQRLDEEEARARRGSEPFAVLCLDLDRFKPVNDTHGHAAGDRLLRGVADRLRGAVRETDLVARLGGDEFVIVQSMAGQPDAARVLAQRIVAALAQPFDLGEVEATISTSIGIALYPADGATGEELLRAADVALYRVKQEGRCGFAFFQSAMDLDVRRRRTTEGELREAVARGELSLAWQPLADARSGRVLGFEVLLRWNHPERGAIPPDVFIPLAESSGAIVQIGEWALREAAREAAGWTQPLRVAVNISALQILQPDFPSAVRGILEESGLEPSRLELEVTETLLLSQTERALATLRALKAIGVCVSLDDFGTGASSLGMLRSFPFDKVKMDRSFVGTLTQDNQSAAIVRAILGLSRGMGLPVVAEGVETEAQAGFLCAAQCEEIQGYFIGRPQPIEAYGAVTGRALVADAA
ncbi:bifunctional diguanylate cyclase/phosphodiesterase [Muricoccus radiodurans]|uniref:bifunctional diguanylate cyclase/phosphodiesterase n=1 Tax=Muricoccus radiodurans TaxID=2231721 RepID=UPI003CF046DB